MQLDPFTIFDKRWFLLAAGDFAKGDFNAMTVSWGFLGTMWGRPVAQIVVRPQRHTRGFLDKYDSFTLCSFPEEFRPALAMLGAKSGRDGDKIAESGLTPIASAKVAAPIFKEADVVFECRKLFRLQMTPESMLSDAALKCYPAKDYHIMYIGEVL
jgi:Conserved protein/domain typically associated with flavoprotein oxygenases, DIM6/NTAB family